MDVEHLRNLPSHRVNGIQRGERVLEDHRDAVAPQPSHLIVAELQQIDAAEVDAA
jgi:hypothetical protein